MPDETGQRAERVRSFNRFYTREIGVLREHLHESEFSLTEVRILYELAHRPQLTASDLARDLSLNAGYVSRVLSRFEKAGLLTKKRSGTDGRSAHLCLTKKGRSVFKPLEAASQREVVAMLERLRLPEQHQLVDAMTQMQSLLSSDDERSYVLRDPQPGDMGWIVHRHGVLYSQEYGWTQGFEALTAEIVASFVRKFDRSCERCWIAERHGKVVGSIFAVRQDADTAQLRLLYVEPSARGLGIGRRLVDECLRFAKQVGYAKMILWTNSVLLNARRIYEAAGFTLSEEVEHANFGPKLVGQTWERTL
jgi:DNA-binding MarR family transcriptional regulator/N-acetylglutamate synthase-like GNAT family acetyltransferase